MEESAQDKLRRRIEGVAFPGERQPPKKKRKAKKYRAPVETHACSKCGRETRIRWQFCRRCSGKTPRPDTDVMNVRVPGSAGSAER
jgi:hypothetical protein